MLRGCRSSESGNGLEATFAGVELGEPDTYSQYPAADAIRRCHPEGLPIGGTSNDGYFDDVTAQTLSTVVSPLTYQPPRESPGWIVRSPARGSGRDRQRQDCRPDRVLDQPDRPGSDRGNASGPGNQHGGTTVKLTGSGLLGSADDYPEVPVGGSPAWVMDGFTVTRTKSRSSRPLESPGWPRLKSRATWALRSCPPRSCMRPIRRHRSPSSPTPSCCGTSMSPSREHGGLSKTAGPFDFWGDPDNESQAVEARFGYGRSGAVYARDYNGLFDFRKLELHDRLLAESFPGQQDYLLAGKQLGPVRLRDQPAPIRFPSGLDTKRGGGPVGSDQPRPISP